VQVPKPIKVGSLTKFAVTSPYLITLTHFLCKLCIIRWVSSNVCSANPANDARHALNVGSPMTDSQAAFWYLVKCQGCKELAHSLRTIHDLALYHSDIPFDTAEKSASFDLKVLWEGFEKMQEKV